MQPKLGKRAEAFLIYRHKENPDIGGVFAFVELKEARAFKLKNNFGADFNCEFRIVSEELRKKRLKVAAMKKKRIDEYDPKWDEFGSDETEHSLI